MAAAPDEIDLDNLDEYSEAEIEAYNQQREQEIREEYAALQEAEQEAVDALREDAQQSLETETVTLDSGVTLQVRARMPPRVESLQDKLQQIETGTEVSVPEDVIHAFDRLDVDQFVELGQVEQSRYLNCYLLAEMVESPEKYSNPDVWALASRDDSAGLQWLAEATDIIVGPAKTNAEDIHEGNSDRASGDTQNQMPGRQSGGWVKR